VLPLKPTAGFRGFRETITQRLAVKVTNEVTNSMITLTAGCRCSELTVYPADLRTNPSSLTHTWYIKYRFYDPAHAHPKQVVLKERINQQFPHKARVKYVEDLLREELFKLQTGYNPFMPTDTQATRTLLDALNHAREHVQVVAHTREDIKSMLRYVSEAVHRLHWENLQINFITRKHIKAVLEECYKRSSFTDNTYNHYRKYLQILFNYLCNEMELIDHNPVTGLSKKKVDNITRDTLSFAERKTVGEFLHKNYYTFWRFVKIFFHSGTRRGELLQVRRSHVNLSKGIFKVKIRKGNRSRTEDKVIMDVVKELWEEVMRETNGNEYLFSEELRPGSRPIRPEQVTRRWNRHVKEKLGITADFYSLKHLHTDLIAEKADIETAAEHDSHTTTAVTERHYAVNEKKRKQERVRKLDIQL
jgi:integrase